MRWLGKPGPATPGFPAWGGLGVTSNRVGGLRADQRGWDPDLFVCAWAGGSPGRGTCPAAGQRARGRPGPDRR